MDMICLCYIIASFEHVTVSSIFVSGERIASGQNMRSILSYMYIVDMNSIYAWSCSSQAFVPCLVDLKILRGLRHLRMINMPYPHQKFAQLLRI